MARYGVIGTGRMGVEHIENLNALPGAEVTAIADPCATSLEHGRAAAGDAVAAFDDHRDLLDSGRCDAVVVATPNHTHIDLLEHVLETDLHVLIEKPLCTTVEDCQRVIEMDATRPESAVTWVGLEYRYMPAATELVAHGRTEQEVCDYIGADRLIFQDLPDLIEEVQKKSRSEVSCFDTSVFSGEYVTGGVDH